MYISQSSSICWNGLIETMLNLSEEKIKDPTEKA